MRFIDLFWWFLDGNRSSRQIIAAKKKPGQSEQNEVEEPFDDIGDFEDFEDEIFFGFDE